MTDPPETNFAETDRLAKVQIKEDRPRARTPDIQHELDVAIFDLTEQNRFRIAPRDGQDTPAGPYDLAIGMAERLLMMEATTAEGDPAATLQLSLSPLRGVIKDYFSICETYFDAVKRLPPSRIEAIDVARRGIHEEGARILAERLEGKIALDNDTARRLFTVICALQFRA